MPPKGQKMSEEQRAKLRVAQRNRPPITEETRTRLSLAHKGKPFTESHRTALAAANRRPDVVAKRSATLRGTLADPNVREQRNARQRGRTFSDEHKAALRASWAKPEVRAKYIAASRGKAKSPEHTASVRATWADPELRARHAEIIRANFTRPEVQIAHAKGRARAFSTKRPTSLETAIAQVLDVLGIVYEWQKTIGPYLIDFFIPDRNLCLETDGAYWHALPSVAAKDARRDAWLTERGYKVLRLKEHAIKADAHLTVIEGLKAIG